jgi:hypothetical protein
MMEQITEQELRQELSEARLRPEADDRHARIYRAVRSISDVGTTYYVLADTPEQTTDTFRILIDDDAVVGFELERDDPEALPKEIQTYSVQDYRKAVEGGLGEVELRIALELARRELIR